MTSYLLPCTCGNKIEVALGQAGDTIECICGKSLNIPSVRGMKQLEPATEKEAATSPKKQWSPIQGALFAFGMLLVVGSITAFIFYGLVYYGNYEYWGANPIVEQQQHNRNILEERLPVETYLMWKEMVKAGLDNNRQFPEYQQAKDTMEICLKRFQLLKATTSIGLIFVTASLLWGRFTKSAKPKQKSKK